MQVEVVRCAVETRLRVEEVEGAMGRVKGSEGAVKMGVGKRDDRSVPQWAVDLGMRVDERQEKLAAVEEIQGKLKAVEGAAKRQADGRADRKTPPWALDLLRRVEMLEELMDRRERGGG